MSVKRALLRWYSRRLWPVTAIVLLVEVVYLLFVRREPLERQTLGMWLFLFAQCAAMSLMLGRYNNAEDEFLYTRGFSRDVLLRHRRIAWVLHAAITWSVGTLIILSGLRSLVQDRWMESAYYPLLADKDATFPLAWLIVYIVCGAFWEYAVVRVVQPSRSGAAGLLLIVGLFFAGFLFIGFRIESPIIAAAPYVALALSTVMLVWAARRLHRTIEVQQ